MVISDILWPEMTISKGHWPKLHVDHHHWPDIWSSWRLRMITDETVAVATQNVPWIAILAGHGLKKEVTGPRSLRSGSRNFREVVKIFKSRKMNLSLQSPAFYANYSRKIVVWFIWTNKRAGIKIYLTYFNRKLICSYFNFICLRLGFNYLNRY